MAYFIPGYINTFWFSITIILKALNRTKKARENGYKYNPTSAPAITIKQLFTFDNVSMVWLNLLTFLLRIN